MLDTEKLGGAIRRAIRMGEFSGLDKRTEDEQYEVLVSISRQQVEAVDDLGETLSIGRSDVLWKGNLVTAREWVAEQDSTTAKDLL